MKSNDSMAIWEEKVHKNLKGKTSDDLAKNKNGLAINPLYVNKGSQNYLDLNKRSVNWLKVTCDTKLMPWADAFFWDGKSEIPPNVKIFSTHLPERISDQEYFFLASSNANLPSNPNVRQGIQLSDLSKEAVLRDQLLDLVNSLKNKSLTNPFLSVHIGQNFLLELTRISAVKQLWFEHTGKIPYTFAHIKPNAPDQEQEQNLIRATLGLSAAIFTGCDAIYVSPVTQGMHNRYAAELALKQQIVLSKEAHLDMFMTPLNGSFALEQMTQELVQSVQDKMK